MKNKIVINGALLAIFYLFSCDIGNNQFHNGCNASVVQQKISIGVENSLQELSMQQSNIDQSQQSHSSGIFDKVINQINQKDKEEADAKEAVIQAQTQKYEKAMRKALQISSPQQNSMDDVKQIMNNIQLSADQYQKPKETYNEKVKRIADEQEEYKDEYGGFGSLTEMIKNKDKLADKVVENLSADEEQARQQQQKQNMIAQAKAKMTEALSKPQKQPAINNPQQKQVIKDSSVSPKVSQSKKQLNDKDKKVETKLVENKVQQNQNQTKEEEKPAPAQPESSTNNTVSHDQSQAQTNQTQNSTQEQSKDVKDSQVTQVIEEVQMEQEQAQSKSQNQTSPEDKKNEYQTYEGGSEEHQGFIGKFNKKLNEVTQQKESPDDVQQTQTEDQEPVIPKRKSITDRFADQVQQDQNDQEKAQELVHKVQHEMDKEKKSPLERATERLANEIDEENDSQLSESINIVDKSLDENQ